RARLRSYFRSDRQRPAVEAALAAVERIEWRELPSELEAGLEELRLIRELRPPANARSARPDRYLYLKRRGDSVICSAQPTELGPLTSRRRAQLAARALQGVEWDTLDDALPKLRAKLKRLARDLRFEDAARLRDRIEALEECARDIARMADLRRLEVVLVAGARAEPTLAPEAADDLRVVAAAIRRPPPELEVLPLRGWTSSGSERSATAGGSWSSTA